jgi:hypothetical protein
MGKLSPEALAILRDVKGDLPRFSERELKILDKAGNLVPFKFRPDQFSLHNKLEGQLSLTGMIRAIILKSRKRGVSTYVGGRFYHKTYFGPGTRTYILTHEDEATKTLFDMVDRFHENMTPALRLPLDRGNAKELRFKDLDAGYEVGTAGNKATGRSKTLQRFHWSEVAFSPNAEAHMAGVMQAVPMAPGTEMILESTANGAGGAFYDAWGKAVRGESVFMPIFEAWFTDPDNVAGASELALAGIKNLAQFKPNKEERALAAILKLTPAQLLWRRLKISELGRADLFQQEYPSTPEEAFLMSGRTVFPLDWLMRLKREVFAPIFVGDLVNGHLVERGDGPLKIWDMPESGRKYAIGADVAEGLLHGDYSSADVLRDDGAQVAQWHGHIDPDKFGDVLVALGYFYRKALIGPERNNHGLTTVTRIKALNYPFLYAQEDLERRSEGHQTKKGGWLTTVRSKPLLMDMLHEELREGTTGIVCADTVSELMTYMVQEDGSYGAAPKRFDDRVMSRAIAGYLIRTLPRR